MKKVTKLTSLYGFIMSSKRAQHTHLILLLCEFCQEESKSTKLTKFSFICTEVTPWNMTRKKEYHPQPSQYSTRANPHPYPQEKRRCHHHDHHDNVYNIYTVYGNYISTDPACNSTVNRTPSHSNTYHQGMTINIIINILWKGLTGYGPNQ